MNANEVIVIILCLMFRPLTADEARQLQREWMKKYGKTSGPSSRR